MALKAIVATVHAIFKQGDGLHDLPSFIFYSLQKKLETASNYTVFMNLAWDGCPLDYKEIDT